MNLTSAMANNIWMGSVIFVMLLVIVLSFYGANKDKKENKNNNDK